MDALNTQKEIVLEVREQGADYVLALKDNHPHLRAEVEGIFEAVRNQSPADQSVSRAETKEQGHGRTERRRGWSVAAPNWLTGYDQWQNLNSLVSGLARKPPRTRSTTAMAFHNAKRLACCEA